MSRTEFLDAAGIDQLSYGRDGLTRWWACGQTVAAPATVVNLPGITAIEYGEPSVEEVEVKQIGQGNKRKTYKRLPVWNGSLTVNTVEREELLATLRGWTAGTDHALVPAYENSDFVAGHMEILNRTEAGAIQGSTIIVDMILDLSGSKSWQEDASPEMSIPFKTYFPPLPASSPVEFVVDMFAGDASTTALVLSGAPLNMVGSGKASRHLLLTETLAFVKVYAASADEGVQQLSGFSESAGTVTATTAAATGEKTEIGYFKVTA